MRSMTDKELPDKRDIETEGGNYSENIGGNYIQADQVNIYNGSQSSSTPQTPLNKDQKNTVVKARVIVSACLTADNRAEFEDKKFELEAIVEHLRQITGDDSIKLTCYEKGSIKLFLEGSPEGLEKLVELFKSGELTDVLGIPVEEVELLLNQNLEVAKEQKIENKLSQTETNLTHSKTRTKSTENQSLISADIIQVNSGSALPSISTEQFGLMLSQQQVQYLKNYYRQLLFSCNLQHLYEAEDILHKVLEKATEVKHSQLQIKNPLAWAKKVGVNCILQYNRKEKAKKKAVNKLEHMMQSEINEDLSDDEWFDDILEALAEALKEIKQIKPDFYVLLAMRFFENLSWNEISSILYPDTMITKKITNRVKRRGSRALDKLSVILRKKISAQNIVCVYLNATENLQIVKIDNTLYERIILPGKKIFFQAPANAYLEINTDDEVDTYPQEIILCKELSIESTSLQNATTSSKNKQMTITLLKNFRHDYLSLLTS